MSTTPVLGLALPASGTTGWASAVNGNFTSIDTAVGALQAAAGAGAGSLVWEGAWASGTAYAIGNVVSFGGSAYVAVAASTGAEPDTHASDWQLMAAGGAAGITWAGPWSGAVAYVSGDAVSYGGSSYIAIAASTNAQPDTNPSSWSPLALAGAAGAAGPAGTTGATGPAGPQGPAGASVVNWRGAWASGTAYAVDDGVSYGGASYIATASSTGAQPDTSPSSWQLLAAAGATGPQGPTGPTGPQGPAGSGGAVASVFGRTGAVTAEAGDYTAAEVTHAADLSATGDQSFSGTVVAPSVSATELGAALAFVGTPGTGVTTPLVLGVGGAAIFMAGTGPFTDPEPTTEYDAKLVGTTGHSLLVAGAAKFKTTVEVANGAFTDPTTDPNAWDGPYDAIFGGAASGIAVKGDAFFQHDVEIGGGLNVEGTLNVGGNMDITGTIGTTGDMGAGMVSMSSASSPLSTTGQVTLSAKTATTASAGSAGAAPAQVAGYLEVSISGVLYKLPYYAS